MERRQHTSVKKDEVTVQAADFTDLIARAVSLTFFTKEIDDVCYCVTFLRNHHEEVTRRDFIKAVDDVIHHLMWQQRKQLENLNL
jgi:hypothetical protein